MNREIGVLRVLFVAFDQAMTTEHVPPATRRRVLNQPREAFSRG